MISSALHNLAATISTSRFATYLSLSGWNRVENSQSNGEWEVYVESPEEGHEPIEIVLPRSEQASGMTLHIALALQTLSAARDEDVPRVHSRIRFASQDLVKIRNLDTDATNSVPLELASIQIPKLKKLVGYAASAEKEARPHYDQLLSLGRSFVREFRFGQTFEGSLGYTIESRPLGESITSYSLFEDSEDEPVTILPAERRVVERIIRGVAITESAYNSGDIGEIVENYESGLNSNMCEAFASLSDHGQMRLGVSVQWSPKAKISSDLTEDEVVVHEGHAQLLSVAADELRRTASRVVAVEGHVVGLTSAENPSMAGRRPKTAIVKWENRPDGRPVQVAVDLTPELYQKATAAHANWTKVRFEGSVQKMGVHWIAKDIAGFRTI